MPLVTGRNPNMASSGLLLPVIAAPSKPIVDMLKNEGKETPKPIELIALVDTGATRTVVRTGTCSKLGLVPKNRLQMFTAGIPCFVDEFDISLSFPMLKMGIPTIFIIEAPLEGQNISCLIGRDLLSRGMLVYNGIDSSFTLGF